MVYNSGPSAWHVIRAPDQYILHDRRVLCAHRCCLESVIHARNRVSCVPSELGSTTVMVNYKCKLQHCSSRRKLKLCQGASCHCCTDALSWRCTSWCPSASGSGSSVRWRKGLARPRAAAAIHTLRTGCFWRPETALASSPSRPLARVASRSHSLERSPTPRLRS